MSTFQQKKLQKACQKEKDTHIIWRDKAIITPDTEMINILELLGKEFKITMIIMLKNLMNRVDHMKNQMGNFSSYKNYRKDEKKQNKTAHSYQQEKQ